MSLDHLHHGVLQVHLALPAGHDPGVSVDLLQRQPLVWTDLDHPPQEVLTVWRDEVRDVEDAALHLEMTVVRDFKKRGLSEKESAGENFNFISFGFSKFMLLIVMFVRNSTELPFWECAVTFARFH